MTTVAWHVYQYIGEGIVCLVHLTHGLVCILVVLKVDPSPKALNNMPPFCRVRHDNGHAPQTTASLPKAFRISTSLIRIN